VRRARRLVYLGALIDLSTKVSSVLRDWDESPHVVLLFVLCQHLPDRHQEPISSIFHFERLRHNPSVQKKRKDKCRTLSSSSASSSLRSSISCTKSRREERRPMWRPGTVRGVGYGWCCRRGMRVGNNGGRGRTVGVATDMTVRTLKKPGPGARFSSRVAMIRSVQIQSNDSGRTTTTTPQPPDGFQEESQKDPHIIDTTKSK
jgi:hypothetical protein